MLYIKAIIIIIIIWHKQLTLPIRTQGDFLIVSKHIQNVNNMQKSNAKESSSKKTGFFGYQDLYYLTNGYKQGYFFQMSSGTLGGQLIL